MSKKVKLPKHVEWKLRSIPLTQLNVPNETYQRKPNVNRVNYIASHYNQAAMRPLVVNKRNGEYQIIDGQHRYLAAKQVGIAYLPCNIIAPALNMEQEALEFNYYNGHAKSLGAMDKFNSLYEGQSKQEQEIYNIVNSAGLFVDIKKTGEKGGIKQISVNTVTTIYTVFGGDYLETVLRILKEGFGLGTNYSAQYRAVMIGLAKFLVLADAMKKPIFAGALIKAMNNETSDKFYKRVKELAGSDNSNDIKDNYAMLRYQEIYNRELDEEGKAPSAHFRIAPAFSEGSITDFTNAIHDLKTSKARE